MKRQHLESRRSGAGPIEVLVIIVILAIVTLLVMMGLTRARESARLKRCQWNLRQIGVAVSLYDQTVGHLPTLSAPAANKFEEPNSPFVTLLMQLGQDDFENLTLEPPPTPIPGAPTLNERLVPGFVCSADPNALSGVFSTPVSYRANTGNTTDGRRGPFAFEVVVRLADVEAGDGLAYTAGFSERLVGNGQDADPDASNYALIPGSEIRDQCPEAPEGHWRGDAGSSWLELSWRSTLYNHAMPLDEVPSCIAEDGRTARIGAMPGHVAGTNVLMLDGGVRLFTRSVNPTIWRDLGSYQSAPAVDPELGASDVPEEIVPPDDEEG